MIDWAQVVAGLPDMSHLAALAPATLPVTLPYQPVLQPYRQPTSPIRPTGPFQPTRRPGGGGALPEPLPIQPSQPTQPYRLPELVYGERSSIPTLPAADTPLARAARALAPAMAPSMATFPSPALQYLQRGYLPPINSMTNDFIGSLPPSIRDALTGLYTSGGIRPEEQAWQRTRYTPTPPINRGITRWGR